MSQTSNIDATVPADDTEPDKSEFRANFAAAKSEINQLFQAVSLPRRIATQGFTGAAF